MAPSGAGSSGVGREQAPLNVPAMERQINDENRNEDLSDEDMALKQQLELYVERVQDSDPGFQKMALESMKQAIRSSTSSMTSVPMPLKFLRPHYGTLKAYYGKIGNSDAKKSLADILSVLAWTMCVEGERESLKFKLLGSFDDVGSWGQEYVRNLADEIGQEYAKLKSEEARVDDLLELVLQIVPFQLTHNAAPEAADLLMEVEYLELLVEIMNDANYKRTCAYLTSSAKYLAGPDDTYALYIAYMINLKFKDYPSALLIALSLDNFEYVEQLYTSCEDLLQKKQFSYILARHGISFELEDDIIQDEGDREALQKIINNCKLNEGYLTLAQDIEVMEPKSPEDIYKARFVDRRTRDVPNVHSAKQNLAATFVNAFVNAGFGQDKLMAVPSKQSTCSWLYKNRDHGKTSTAASLGMILLWDVDAGLSQIDKFVHSHDNHVVAGALIGAGMASCNIKNNCDPVLALSSEYLSNRDTAIRIGAIMGLGLAYAGSQNLRICMDLEQILRDPMAPLDVIAFASITLGLVFVGSCFELAVQAIIYALMGRNDNEFSDPLARLVAVGLGLLYLGKQECVEDTAKVFETFHGEIAKYCGMTLLSCAYAGTGNVLTVQTLLGECGQPLEEGETHHGPAVLGIAMVAMAEELGLEMAIRSLEHLLQYGELNIRRAVPLALGMLCISNPNVNVMNTLGKLCHDANTEVAMAGVISLGLIGAGTNNARIASMLRKLSSFYYKEANLLFCVRIAQGFVHMGKGLLTLAPYHCDRFLLSPTALAGIVLVLHACLDMKGIVLGKYHYVLYFLALAMQPRMLLTVDETLRPLPVQVRVGKAVDVVGLAGKPKTITGFQYPWTPVLLAAGEKAELETEKYIPLSPVLEGFVVLKKNPEYRDDK